MSVLYACYCGYTQREPPGHEAPRCREVAHLAEDRVDWPTMRPVAMLDAEHLPVVREALATYRPPAGAPDAAAAQAALDALGARED